jgi:hypothetical protein
MEQAAAMVRGWARAREEAAAKEEWAEPNQGPDRREAVFVRNAGLQHLMQGACPVTRCSVPSVELS